jgi:hypothetical protein
MRLAWASAREYTSSDVYAPRASMPELTRYWIEFARDDATELPLGTVLGVGVTALGRDDALALVRDRVVKGSELPSIAALIEDVDVSTLDAGHVLPNMAPPVSRGIWFPHGYV